MKLSLLQIQEATGLFSETAQLGVAFALLVAIIFVESWLIVKLYKESKSKSIAHGLAMDLKDKKIEEITEKRRLESIEIMTFIRDHQDKQTKYLETITKLYENK